MKNVRKVALAACAFSCAAMFSFGWTEQGVVSLSVEGAQARVGRPLTPVSVAGVARRQARRGAYGVGVVGAGAAAVGTVAAIAAAPPYGGWGNTRGTNNWGNAYAAQTDAYYGQPHYVHRAYHGHSPYYGYGNWDDYAVRNAIRCTPGSYTKLDDGRMYVCQ
jgi:hypothetical protein